MMAEAQVPLCDDLGRYLEALFGRARPSGLIELRWRVPAGMRQRFVPVAERERLIPLMAELVPVADVYVSVLPRWRPAGGRGAVVGDCRTVWVDLDTFDDCFSDEHRRADRFRPRR
jgi:hypothetical protein